MEATYAGDLNTYTELIVSADTTVWASSPTLPVSLFSKHLYTVQQVHMMMYIWVVDNLTSAVQIRFPRKDQLAYFHVIKYYTVNCRCLTNDGYIILRDFNLKNVSNWLLCMTEIWTKEKLECKKQKYRKAVN